MKRIRNVFLLLALILQGIFFLILYRRFSLEIPEDKFTTPLYLFFIVSTLLRFALDLYVLKNTVSYFVFIIKRRLIYFEMRGQGIPMVSKVIMVWITMVLFMISLEMTFICVISLLIPGGYVQGGLVSSLIDYQRFLSFPIFDLVVSSTITYVFYH